MSATVNNYEIIYTADNETAVFSRQFVEAETEEQARHDFLSVFPFAVIATVIPSSNNCLQSDPD